jgi:membrane fusion protein (multidrug efflux system)
MNSVSPLSFAAVATAALLAACSGPEQANVAPPPEVLVTAPVQRDVPITREWLATLDGSANVVVRPRVQGYLTKILYTAGSEVKEGETLFEIDHRPFAASLAQAEAALAQAEAIQVKAELDAGRQVSLFASKAVSEQDRDAAVQNNEAAKANVQAAKAAVDLASINLEFTRITAPVRGIIGIPNPGIGDLVGPTGSDLTKISTVDPIKATFQVSEQEYLRGEELLNRMMSMPLAERPADLELILADGSIHPEKGKFLSADRQIDPKTGTLAVETHFPNPGNKLRPGLFARIRAVIRIQKDALLVPQRAVTETQGAYHLVIIGEGDKPEIRPVKVGDRIGPEWVITSGLKPGERVVVEGLQKARPGTTVVPKPWSPPAPSTGTQPAAATKAP